MTVNDVVAHARISDVIDRARNQYRQGYFANANMLKERAINLMNEYIAEKEYGKGSES